MPHMKSPLLFSLLLAFSPVWAAHTGLQTAAGAPTHDITPLPEIPAGAKARNVILMIGDGMGSEHVWAGWLANHGKLTLEQLPVTGFSRTPSGSATITDSAAGGTAMACGVKAVNHHVGQNVQGESIDSLLVDAERLGKSTGLLATKDITDATPASFYAHVDSRKQKDLIAAALPGSGAEFVWGGGSEHFSEQQLQEMRAHGMNIELPCKGDMVPASQRGDALPEATARALAVLEQNPAGFFLMVEGSQIDVAAHANNLNEVVHEVLDFDKAIGVVLDWMKNHPDTLLVITADHQTGGLSLLGGSVADGRVEGVFTTDYHSGVSVPVYAIGPGADVFGGIQENTDLHDKLQRALQAE